MVRRSQYSIINLFTANIFLCLIIFSSSAQAQWKYIYETDDLKFYYDPSSLVKKNSMIKVWSVIDYKILAKNSSTRSELSQEAWDCDNQTSQLIMLKTYSGQMLSGEELYSQVYSNAEIRPIIPSTYGMYLLRLICKK